MAGDNYPDYNPQVEMSPAQDVSCVEHLDSPGDIQQTETAHANSLVEAAIACGMSSPTEPQSTAMPKPPRGLFVFHVLPPCKPQPIVSQIYVTRNAMLS